MTCDFCGYPVIRDAAKGTLVCIHCDGVPATNDSLWHLAGGYLVLPKAKFGIGSDDMYDIAISQLGDAASVCRWLATLVEKRWASDRVLGSFVRSLHEQGLI